MIIDTVEDLRHILDGTDAEVIEIDAPVQSVHQDKFELWTDDDDAEYESDVAAIWDPTDPDYDSPAPYYAVYAETQIFENAQDIRETLGGKKIFFYTYGTLRANLDTPPGPPGTFGETWVGVPMTDGKIRLRFAIWESQ